MKRDSNGCTDHDERRCELHCFEKNAYYYGKELVPRDFEAEQRYHDGKRWLINRTVLGTGVVCGLGVAIEGECLVVQPGVAIDPEGRELVSAEELRRSLPQLLLARLGPLLQDPNVELDEHLPKRYEVCLELHEVAIEPVERPASVCDGREHTAYNRICESVCLVLREPREVEHSEPTCAEHRCPRPDCEGELEAFLRECSSQPCCSERGRCVPLACVRVDLVDTPGGRKQAPKASQSGVITLCGRQLRVDIDDSCRKLLHRNEALFDLLRCFHTDVPRITEVRVAGQPMPPTMRLHMHESAVEAALQEGVELTLCREVLAETVDACSVFLVHHPVRGDLERLEPLAGHPTLQNGTRIAWKLVEGDRFRRGDVIEITVRGALVRDSNGRALDGTAIQFPTGAGQQGQDFIACIVVTDEKGAV